MNMSFAGQSSEVSHTTWNGWGTPIVFHLTPLGKRNLRLRTRRWNEEQAQIVRDNRRAERESRLQSAKDREAIRRMERQEVRLLRLLTEHKISRGQKHTCAACAKTAHCFKYRDIYFCPNCLKLGKNKEIEVVCPRHKTWCGGHYGSCGGCLGEWCASASLV
jgi:hypothetical protein